MANTLTVEQSARLEALARKAETGEQWAEIARLEAGMVAPVSPAVATIRKLYALDKKSDAELIRLRDFNRQTAATATWLSQSWSHEALADACNAVLMARVVS